ncbi:MAG TPA: hypothetical protein VFK86_01545 [Bauldia sp.]|nr:hypothetical protein [Bauldia sp.]
MRVARPVADHEDFQMVSAEDLSLAQSLWDQAEQQRLNDVQAEADRTEQVARYETREEPAAKALENRARVAFLATKGATMKMWLDARDNILADLYNGGSSIDH